MKEYIVGNFLVCKEKVNGQEIEMTNPNVDIEVGEVFVITEFTYYSDECNQVEILCINGEHKGLYFSGYNDLDEHEIFDERFNEISINELRNYVK